MRYHAIYLLRLAIKLYRLATLGFDDGTVFFVFLGPLCGLLLGVFLEYFTLFRRVSGSMHKAFFVTGHPIAQMTFMIFLMLSRAALLGISS